MIQTKAWDIVRGAGPVVATAIHAGHGLRPEVAERMALDEPSRLREEDPFTDEWTAVGDHRVVARRSRFEVDLNRSRPTAVYRAPEDAWGLEVWRQPLPDGVVARSLDVYDVFYDEVLDLVESLVDEHGRVLVLDIHSYNHRREGPDGLDADPEANPEVNVGTGTMRVRARWAPVIDTFIAELGGFDFAGRGLDVRENVKFVGRQLPDTLHRRWPEAVCVLSLEFKKFFMDEWTGIPDRETVDRIGAALAATLGPVRDTLRSV